MNLLFLTIRSFLFSRKILPYILLATPALAIEIWFERIGRPTYTSGSDGQKELKRAGEDLEAKGLTEWMWDIVYWTWGCTALAALFGNWAWWLYLAVPIYSGWLAFSTYSGVRQGMGGLTGAGGDGQASGGQSKRQVKMERRGGPKVTYR